ncbi:hypothetical protein OPKNFCMD_2538 [Methylobacterium crusticola]|uniref:MarR family transcriptional regulator n=1 Tax=Methylobacterium crusticola TaxID=1697972 RepID=A0ABQ4QYR0_9HYPH|nr:hypothetical protein [Methylobacterium crusticola]GJD49804.1 hypothetical protein OPKNFCMD_2538 [Methylobacterium crusticola]
MTPEQYRLMSFLDQVGGWVALFELTDPRHFVDDDDLFVPSLVARGWVDHDADDGAVRITETGRTAYGAA